MNSIEHRKVMDELKVPKFKYGKKEKVSLKDRISTALDDTRMSEYGICFIHRLSWTCAYGIIPVQVILNTYKRIGDGRFTRVKSFDSLTREELKDKNNYECRNRIKFIKDIKFGNLKDFIVFYDELCKYYGDDLYADIDKMYGKVVQEVSKRCKFDKTPETWVKRHYPTLKFRPKLTYSVNYYGTGQVNIRKLLDEFDKAVNPFLNKDIELDEIGNIARRICINTDYSSIRIGEPMNNTYYSFKPDKISFNSYFNMNDDSSEDKAKMIEVQHRFVKPSKPKTPYSEFGEILEISKYGSDCEDSEFITLNLTTGIINEYGNKRDVTREDMIKIITDLYFAIALINQKNVSKMVKPKKQDKTRALK